MNIRHWMMICESGFGQCNPMYDHDCKKCVFCGQIPFKDKNIADIYACSLHQADRDAVTVVVRYSDEGKEYTSFRLKAASKLKDYKEAGELVNKTLDEIGFPHKIDEAVEQPYINAHRSGDIIWIDMMAVPQRGEGFGRRYYEEWEAQLPPDIKLIQLVAADTGHGKSNGFWEAMGFEYKYSGMDDLDYEALQAMWKGVNGNPTPDPIGVDEDE